MTEADGEAFSALSRACPDTGLVQAFARYHVAPLAALEALRPETMAVVAEGRDDVALAGSACVSISACRVGGEVRPAALFHTLMVHPAHRRRGLAAELTRVAVAIARARLGKGGIVFAHVQRGNVGSLRAIGASLPHQSGSLTGGVVRMRARPPRSEPSWMVRPIREADLEAVAAGLDAFYVGHDLYPRETARSFGERLARSPLAAPIRRAYVVTDRAGIPRAGLTVVEQGLLRTLEIERIPPLMRLANRVLRVLPPDRVLRQLGVESVWVADGHLGAARHLWETVRWELRSRGHAFITLFDPRSPVREVFRIPRWLPATTTTLLHDGAAPRSGAVLLYPFV
jgi:GNAT superfamily N-acetyltransferase